MATGALVPHQGGKHVVEAPQLDGPEGWTAAQVFDEGEHGFTLDEIAILPGKCIQDSDGGYQNVDVVSRLTKNILLRTPIIGGADETVCESTMAISLAIQGGIGIIHRRQGVREQCAMVRRVKMYETGFILDPCVLGPRSTAADVEKIKVERGAGTVPITKNGKMGGELVGIVTTRDHETVTDKKALVADFMTVDVVTATQPVSLPKARKVMAENKVGKLPVVNEDKELVALICRGDIKRTAANPNASRDQNSQLMVAAEFGCSDEDDFDRAQALLEAGADVLVMDLADGGVSDYAVDVIKRLKAVSLGTDIIVGPVSSCKQANDLINAGADGLMVGGENAKRFEASALHDIAKCARANHGVPVIAACGVRDASQFVKCLCLGASAVALVELLDGTEEIPGDHYYHDGVRVKIRRTKEVSQQDPALQGGPLVYAGTGSTVVSRGSVATLVPYIIRGLQVVLQELGVVRLQDVSKLLAKGEIRFERQMSFAAEEPPKYMRAAASALHNRW